MCERILRLREDLFCKMLVMLLASKEKGGKPTMFYARIFRDWFDIFWSCESNALSIDCCHDTEESAEEYLQTWSAIADLFTPELWVVKYFWLNIRHPSWVSFLSFDCLPAFSERPTIMLSYKLAISAESEILRYCHSYVRLYSHRNMTEGLWEKQLQIPIIH